MGQSSDDTVSIIEQGPDSSDKDPDIEDSVIDQLMPPYSDQLFREEITEHREQVNWTW